MIVKSRVVPGQTQRARRESRMDCSWKVALLLLLAASAASRTDAEDLTTCIAQPVTFDGTTPLTYETVTAPSGGKAPLHGRFPKECSASQHLSCTSTAYLVSGDTVALGKTCGPWAYVQYIGERKISVGWIDLSRLSVLKRIAPRASKMMYGPFENEPIFLLTKGHQLPVCEAYLQRLNQTEFHGPAYCGRPEDDQVPGFVRLVRVGVPLATVSRLYRLVYTILDPESDSVAEWEAMNANDGVFAGNLRGTEVPSDLRLMLSGPMSGLSILTTMDNRARS